MKAVKVSAGGKVERVEYTEAVESFLNKRIANSSMGYSIVVVYDKSAKFVETRRGIIGYTDVLNKFVSDGTKTVKIYGDALLFEMDYSNLSIKEMDDEKFNEVVEIVNYMKENSSNEV